MSRISGLFERARTEGRPALIAYITAGDPTPDQTVSLAAALQRGGADLIELGVPFSDPIADGPVIQRGSDRALRAGTTVRRVLQIAREIRQNSEIPLLLFSYMNPLMRYGLQAVAEDAAAAGVDGVLLTDMSVEEAGKYIDIMRRNRLDTVFLVAPTSTEERLQLVAKYSSGFIYLVSRTGVTGEQTSISASVAPLVQRTRRVTDLPLAVGFGISTAAQVEQIGGHADGVVVGSALVRLVERHAAEVDLPQKLEAFTRELAGGLRRRATA